METLTIILDADDTLWENNVFYEDATDGFVERMAAEGYDPQEARETFVRIEHERVVQVGYAPEEFVRSMVIAYRHLCRRHGRAPRVEIEEEVADIGRQVIDYPIALLEGVADTLPRLQRRCRLILLTKGDLKTQQGKVDRSGLACHFDAVHVVPEKRPEVLVELLTRYDLDPGQTWMVGNSPRSDVNPALAAGIGAVYIPYSMPWDFEQVPFSDPERVVTVSSFFDLVDLFLTSEEKG